MKCEEFDELELLLSAYCDGETDALESARVERHVAACAHCADELRLLRLASETLRALPEIAPPAALRGAILAATVQRPGWRVRLAGALSGIGRPASIRYAAALGCAALLVALVRTATHPGSPSARRHSLPPMTASLPQPPAPLRVAETPAPPAPQPNAATRVERAATKALLARLAEHPHAAERNTPVQIARLESRALRRSIRPRESGTMRVAAGTSRAVRPAPLAAPEPSAQPDGITIEPADMIQPTPAAPDPAEKVASAKAAGTGATAAAPTLTHIELASVTASAAPIRTSQMVTLADLKRALRHRQAEMNIQADLPAGRDRQIRVEIVHGRF